MRSYVLGAVLLAGLVSAGSVWAQDDEDFDKEMRNIEIQRKQMDLQQRHAEFEFQQEIRNLELEKKRAELEKQRHMMNIMPQSGPQMAPGIGDGCSAMGGPCARGGMQGPRPACVKGSRDCRGDCPGCDMSRGPGAPCRNPDDIRKGVPRIPPGHAPCCKGPLVIMLLGALVIHILLAIWVSGDIRQKNSGSGIWVVVTLMAGLIGALVYAVVRLGDARQP